jgi:hypothetical protein
MWQIYTRPNSASDVFGKGPDQGQIPGLLGHGPQIPGRTIDHCKSTDLCSKFSYLCAIAAEK